MGWQKERIRPLNMLDEKHVPKSFCPDAVKWCVLIQNQSPTTTVKHKTPKEAWSCKKPGVGYFMVFRCIAYAHVSNQLRRKLDDNREKSIFCWESVMNPKDGDCMIQNPKSLS